MRKEASQASTMPEKPGEERVHEGALSDAASMSGG